MLQRLFEEIDIDGSGTLDRDEIAQLAAKLDAQLSPADLDQAMSQVRCRSHFNLARLASMQLPVTSVATAMRCPSGLAPHPTRCAGTVRAALLRGAAPALAEPVDAADALYGRNIDQVTLDETQSQGTLPEPPECGGDQRPSAAG